MNLLRTALCALLALLPACDTTDSDRAVYEVEIETLDGPERFRLALATDAQIAFAEAAIASRRTGVVHGTLARGDGGFNEGYSWHLDPASVTFPDFAIEVCDGRPRTDVEGELDYWFERIGIYCPWGARLVRRLD